MSKLKSNMMFMNDNILRGSGMQFDLATGQLVPDKATPFHYDDIVANFQSLDLTDALARYRWYNLPSGLTGDLIERILYFRYKGIFIYIKDIGKLFFLPYTLGEKDGLTGIDVYGQYQVATPIPFNGKSDPEDFKGMEQQKAVLATQTRKILRSITELAERLKDNKDNPLEAMTYYCVELKDYVNGIPQVERSRYQLQRPFCLMQANALCYADTAALNKSGVKAIRVQSEDEQSQVWTFSNTLRGAALSGRTFIPVVGATEMQELSSENSDLQAQLMYLEAINNQRLRNYGLPTAGIATKSTYRSNDELGASANAVANAYDKGLELRQNACNLLNALMGTSIYCLPNENCIEQDLNGDGALFSDKDQSGQADNSSNTAVETNEGGE